MQFNKINETTFGAKYIARTKVQKYDNKKNLYKPCEVSFVELKPSSSKDLIAAKDTLLYWENRDYIENIVSTLEALRKGNLSNKTYKIYALTRQNKDFKKLRAEKILCLAEVQKLSKGSVELNYLQVDPAIVYAFREKAFKQVGSAFLNVLKSLDKVKSIVLSSACSATDFYEKNGFKMVAAEKLRYYWKK